jgi:hypothetical protein
MDQDFTFPVCHPTHLIHTSHSPNIPTTKLRWSPRFLSSEHCQEILQTKFICRSGKLSSSAKPQSCCNQAAGLHSPGKGWGPLLRWNVLSWMKPQIVVSNNPPVPKTDTRETENLDKAIFSWSRGCKHVLTPAKEIHKHKMADSDSLHPWRRCICPSPGICPGQRFTVFPDKLTGLGDGLGHAEWQARELYRKQGPFKHASHLRW